MADQSNLQDADRDLKLTDQEKYLYNKHLDNLWGEGGVNNSDDKGNVVSRSSLYASIEPRGGKFYTVPSIWNGKRETEEYTRPADGKLFNIPNETALKNVDKEGWDKYPSYKTPEEAESRYLQMHDYMDRDTGSYFNMGNLGDVAKTDSVDSQY